MTPRDKVILDRCYQKAVKNTKVKKDNKRIATAVKAKKTTPEAQGEAVEKPVGIVDQAKPGTRTQLMNEAKAKGIKYFRILSKEDLGKVLSPETTQETINQITEAAKKKWQQGWNSKKKRI